MLDNGNKKTAFMNAKYNYIDAQMRADINYNIICNIVIM